MGFYTRVAGPVALHRVSWVGFRFFITVTLACMAVLALLVTATPASAAIPDPPACEPRVIEIAAVPFWENYNDYLDRRLTIDESVENSGGCLPCLLRIAQVDPDEGVSLETKLPIDLGELQPAAGTTFRMKFRVPPGVSRFHSRARFICRPPVPRPEPLPATGSQLTIQPPFAWANEGCPVSPPPEMAGQELPADLGYTSRLFTATLVDENGDPMPGKTVKWHLSNNIDFRIIDSTGVTDELGNVTVLVTPPQYFICVVPYFDRGVTRVTAVTEDRVEDTATFVYTRCAPLAF
ncbi:MAG: Ig-like domain-containing protein [Thermoleophilia bacterium]|nr:Ig-like domain-containing protein [Thermoleophilia bacterium]